MSPAPAADHQKINGRLFTIFENALQSNCNKYETFLPVDWKIDDKTVVQPDLVIVCNKLKKDYLDITPALAVEIISPSSALKDRHEKFELYEQEGVQYYIIIDPRFKKLEIYDLIKGKYKLSGKQHNQFVFNLVKGCQFSLNFDGIWP